MKAKYIIFGILYVLLFQCSFAQDNVILIIADDLGIDYMEKYGLGSDPAPTPVLDSLADNGVLFSNAWTNPICSPSRANILTGKYGFRTGIGTAITGPTSVRLDTSEFTLPKAIKYQTGASTAMVGKWHLGHNSQAFRLNPNRCGFDLYSGNVEGQIPNYGLWTKTVNGSNSVIWNYATSEAVDDAIDWIDDQSGNWFLTLSFNAPHVPFHKPPNALHSFDALSGNQSQIDANPIPYFKAMVESMDTEIGRLLDHLRSEGELDNTNIVFLGDNGTDSDVVQAPFDDARAKGTMYNGGVQVPFIVSGPSVISPGRTAGELVNSTDIFYTVLEMMGGNPDILPADVALDSRSFLPVLQNSSDSGSQRSWIYGDLFKPVTPSSKDGKAITDGIYKLIRFDTGGEEFYHTDIDPFENTALDISGLNTVEQDHYDFLCGEMGNLLDTMFCDISTSVQFGHLEPLGIYPNPVRDLLHLNLGSMSLHQREGLKGRIYDSKGELMQVFRVIENNDQSLDVSGLSPGTYSIVLSSGHSAVAGSGFVKW
ncbi:MAG: sulfatase-like hydrolase/transferase [Bacteroidetes bacterium]|nr:sulfatase-like hydrolase/transferase [Bacteroidota bacterium]